MVRLHAGCDSAARAAVLKLDADGHDHHGQHHHCVQ